MVSPTKHRDREARTMLLETMQIALRWYERTQDEKWLDWAKTFGSHSKTLKEKIETHDYSRVDKILEKVFR